MYYVYILLSCKDGKRYIGSTNNIARRFREHNSGKVAATKFRRPMKLLYSEKYAGKHGALVREKYLKTHKGYNELKKLLSGCGAVG